MMDRLLPCPYCGDKEPFVATVEHGIESRPNGYRFHGQIMCRVCQATAGTTGFDTTHEEATDKAIAAWNRRAEPDEIARLRAELARERERAKMAEADMKVMALAMRESDELPEACCFACIYDAQNLPDNCILAYGECPGYDKTDCFEWRGPQDEEGDTE